MIRGEPVERPIVAVALPVPQVRHVEDLVAQKLLTLGLVVLQHSVLPPLFGLLDGRTQRKVRREDRRITYVLTLDQLAGLVTPHNALVHGVVQLLGLNVLYDLLEGELVGKALGLVVLERFLEVVCLFNHFCDEVGVHL